MTETKDSNKELQKKYEADLRGLEKQMLQLQGAYQYISQELNKLKQPPKEEVK